MPPLAETDANVAAIDRKYCGGPCRFVLPIFLMEQESKAQMHFRQLAFMAGMANRTIVLPNVGRSRLGACLEHDFSFYYSEEWARKNGEHFKYITMTDFRAWLAERQEAKPRSQHMYIHLDQGRVQMPEVDNCFASQLDIAPGSEQRLYLHETSNTAKRAQFERQVKAFLLGNPKPSRETDVDRYQHIEVLSVFYDRRFPFVHHPDAAVPIAYSTQLVALADALSAKLAPYCAVHWRTERVDPPENLVFCAESLVSMVSDRLESVKAIDGVKPNFFLLTDYPHIIPEKPTEANTSSDFMPASSSFSQNSLTRYHHAAIHYLYKHMQIQLTHLEQQKETPPVHTPANWTMLPIPASIAAEDTGFLGILDKLLAIRADVFLAGKPGVCGRKSSFTSLIIHERLRRQAEESGEAVNATWSDYSIDRQGQMRNIIDYFDLPPDIITAA
ncbi:uncharacterized protein BYT42DRAFT_494449 [Radiomyces spectabilis]|uniref:uncharacterized protein n=1 Tax=Radiomyces spectabilis TaxID=64574 RepID=UPI002220D5CB|nr:uncharacterized protein BYT42DRAFT_494449 [Radiomyces spectabilis]KAI8381523.1 hypothetical protein BYT42DRAFT_494449 [Radiomyces spectabilis]